MLNKIKLMLDNYKVQEVVAKVEQNLAEINFEQNFQSQIKSIEINRRQRLIELFDNLGRGAKVVISKITGKNPSLFSRYMKTSVYPIPEEFMLKLEYFFGNTPLNCFLLDKQLQNLQQPQQADGITINHLKLLDVVKDCPQFSESVWSIFPAKLKSLNFDENYAKILFENRQDLENIKFVVSNDDLFAPDVRKGDVVFFDLAHGKFSGDAVYLIAFDNALIIRRVQKISAGQYQLSYNDSRYSPITQPADDLFFIGKLFRSLPISRSKNIL